MYKFLSMWLNLLSCIDNNPKNSEINSTLCDIEDFEWYDESKHKIIIIIIISHLITGYEIDKTLFFDNYMNNYYEIYCGKGSIKIHMRIILNYITKQANYYKINMEITIWTIDNKEYKTFTLPVRDTYVTVASFELNEKVEQMIDEGRYDEVIHIDDIYGYVLPEGIEENDIRESIETIIDETLWQE